MVTNTQLALTIGIPTLAIILTNLSLRAQTHRLMAKLDTMNAAHSHKGPTA
jgi:hypothetical protein